MTLQALAQHPFVNVIKELRNIGSPDPAMAVAHNQLLATLQCSVQPLAGATRPDVIVQFWINNRYQVVIQQAVDDPIPYSCHGNITALFLVDNPVVIPAVQVAAVINFGTEYQ